MSFSLNTVGSWGETFDCRYIKTKEKHDVEYEMYKRGLRYFTINEILSPM